MTAIDITSSAEVLAQARRGAVGLPGYPGAVPTSLADAYAVQAEAIRLWGSTVAGWKVGRIVGEAAATHGCNRFIGPIFAETVMAGTTDTLASFPAIRDGSAALEAEVVAIIGRDVPAIRRDWTGAEVRSILSGLHIGIEVAGCPVPDANGLGPLASIGAFGNNLALILGPAIAEWESVDIDAIACSASIDGRTVGDATAANLPGGPLTATAFALNQAAERGIAIPAGTLISTGAITGVHAVRIGQSCVADFGPLGVLRCLVAEAAPSS